MALLAEGSGVSDAARSLKRRCCGTSGSSRRPRRSRLRRPLRFRRLGAAGRAAAVISRQLANPFLAPDFSAVPQRTSRPRRLAAGSCSARC
jgi:hypothetical protein